MVLRSLLALAILAVAGVPAAPSVTTAGLSPAQVAVVSWAVARYEAAGLDLPPVRVVGHGSLAPCHGVEGWHVASGGRSTVHLCGGSHASDRFLVLHELGHAWDHANLDDLRRSAFLARRGLARWWDDGSTRWHERGAEQAAEVLVWGLHDRPVRAARIGDPPCGELTALFTLLTARAPLTAC